MGGGTGPAHGTRATTCTPGPFHMKLMLQSTDDMPLNFGFTGKVSPLFHQIGNYDCHGISYCLLNHVSLPSLLGKFCQRRGPT